jgi:hypothetical protein
MQSPRQSRGPQCRTRVIGKSRSEPCCLLRVVEAFEEFKGGSNGTRNSALAFGCADPGHHPAVVVLWSLKPDCQCIGADQAVAEREA